jgi:N,N'-diacetylbacillosaminyl-diphospho-undecaprenol alpha-1,3-N-acetylgalactosaminyltransferase
MVRVCLISHVDVNLTGFRRPLMEKLVSEGHEVFALCPVGEKSSMFSKLGVTHVPYSLNRRSINPFGGLLLIFKLYLKILKLRPDIVHTFTAKPNILGTFAAKMARTKTIVNSVTGLGSIYIDQARGSRKARILAAIVDLAYKMAFTWANAIVFQNLDDKREFVAKGLVDEKKAVLIKGSGVDTTKFYAASAIEASAVKESLGIFADQVVVTMVARIIKDKGIFEYLDAATKLRAKYGEKTLFLLIGDSDLGNPTSVNIENMKHVGSKESGVWYLGARDDIVRVLHASDVYCLPSYREGLPMSVLEAMASGLPIVTTDAPGCRETVLEGINGYLVPVRDSNKIAEALDALISDSDMRQRFGAASRRRATQEFSKEKVVAEFVDLYMQLLQKK